MKLVHDHVLFGPRRITNVQDPLARFFNFQNKYWSNVWLVFKNIVEFLVISLIVVIIVYFLLNAIPGAGVPRGLDDNQVAIYRAQNGLDRPAIVQFFAYIGNIFQGNFGLSTAIRENQPISSFIWARFGVSFTIGIISVFVTLVIGIPLGILVGRKPGGILDNVSTVFISIMISIPSLVFSILVFIIGRAAGLPYIFDISSPATFILPVIALSLGSVVIYVRYIRTELNRELNSMHAKFAYLKGVSRSRFVWMHALKPSLFPVATFFPAVVLSSFIGSLFIERVFAIPGSGGLLLQAISDSDINVVLFLIIVFVFVTIVSFTSRDILYKVIDPRLRRGGH